MRKATKYLEISKATKEKVWERDNEKCVLCGSTQALPYCHYVARSQGGLGIEQNIVTLCMCCHYDYDFTNNRNEIRKILRAYLQSKYTDWNENDLYYRKGHL